MENYEISNLMFKLINSRSKNHEKISQPMLLYRRSAYISRDVTVKRIEMDALKMRMCKIVFDVCVECQVVEKL